MNRHKLVIATDTESVTLPVTKSISVSGKLESTEIIMANGTTKYDVVGFRKKITYSYRYIAADVMANLHMLLRNNVFFNCTYLDVDNVEKTEVFKISYPETSVFMYKDGVAVWQDAVLTLTARDLM